ncbi:MAG: metal ABC transporter substrate-binding protein [Planctomycetota bacterium]
MKGIQLSTFKPTSLVAILAITLAAMAACGDEPKSGSSNKQTLDRLVVATTFYPTTYFAERILGDLGEVKCPVPADADPIFWKPRDEDIATFVAADLIILNGAEFEKWVASASLPESRVVNSAQELESEFLNFESGATTHSHGPQGEHSHEGLDGHTWLDPLNAKRQAQAITKAMVRLLPQNKATLEANARALNQDLDTLDKNLRNLVAEIDKLPAIFASHPAYNYLAKRYKLPIINLDLDPESIPSDSAIQSIAQKAKSQSIRAIIWESQPTPEVAAAFKKRCGLTSFVVSPAETLDANSRASGTHYLSIMNQNLRALGEAFATQ